MRKKIIEKARDDDQRVLLSRAYDLYQRAERTKRTFYTDFLSSGEEALFTDAFSFLSAGEMHFFGGYDDAERKMCAFGDEPEWPFEAVRLVTKNKSPLAHRAVMGTVLSLGIERQTIGDIVVKDEKAWIFCVSSLASFVASSLTKVGSVGVVADICAIEDVEKIQRDYLQKSATVSSMRLDSVVSAATQKARSTSDSLITGGLVFVNSRPVVSKSAPVKDGDILTVRGEGKFLIKTQNRLTKKGRIAIEILKYI